MGANISSLANKTVVGWVVILATLSVVGYRQVQHNAKGNKASAQRLRGQERQTQQPKKESKAKRQRLESFATESKQNPPQTYAAAASAPTAKASRDTSDDGVDNHAFAQQMARNKQSKFAPKTTTEQKQKSVKQSKARDISETRATPSTTGAHADDDQSSISSPPTHAADSTGVSDMLEQPASGPSVLRLTGTENKPQQKAKQAKSPEPTETKKQRQNRQKREQEKAFREEEEKQRKVKLEAQRRAAREAEGRAAKDGSAFMAAQKKSAWTGNSSNGNATPSAAATALHQPLDTFDSNSQADSTASAATTTNGKENTNKTNKTNGQSNGQKTSWADIPYSEEEQMAMLQKESELEGKWVSVSSRKNKKSSAGSVNSDAGESATETSPPPARHAQASKAKPEVSNGRPKPHTVQTQSSFAALSDDGADLEEEEEHEWEV